MDAHKTPDAVREAKALEIARDLMVKHFGPGKSSAVPASWVIEAMLTFAALDSRAGYAWASTVICEDVTCDGDPCTATQKAAGTFDAGVGWRCYHCGDTFTDDRSARLHFGRDEDSAPACQIKAGAEHGLLGALREAEYAAADAQQAIANEYTEAAKAYYAQATRHAAALRNAEEAGYERGLADGRSLSATPAPAVDAQTLVQRFRDASRGLGRAGTTEWPGGPYMSMADAAAVYADLMRGGTGRGVVADDAVPAGEVEQ